MNVHAAELVVGTSPQLKGPFPVQPDTLVKVGALTPDPSNITDNGPIWRFALNDAVEVGVKLTQIFSAIAAVEFGGMIYGTTGGYSNVNPDPASVVTLIVAAVVPVLKTWNCTLSVVFSAAGGN
jgi:hypothetical protein